MTIDEAIKYAEEIAKEKEERAWETQSSEEYMTCKEYVDKYRQLTEWLKELKQLREQTKWIPCSERLPEDRRVVLVTAYWHETYQVMMASYFGDGLWWCVPFNNSGDYMQKLKPKAWMPLLASYQGE